MYCYIYTNQAQRINDARLFRTLDGSGYHTQVTALEMRDGWSSRRVDGGIWLGVRTVQCGIRIPGRELSVGDPTRYRTLGLVIAICAVPTDVGDRRHRDAAY